MPSLREFPGASTFVRCAGIVANETVFILSDPMADPEPVRILADACSAITKFVDVDCSLPLEVAEDFPQPIRQRIGQYDVIILAASQSWYHANTRKEAKYRLKRRVIECYGLNRDALTGGGLCADYGLVADLTTEMASLLAGKNKIRITTKAGTDIVGDMTTVKPETGLYITPGSGGNLPAGEISICSAKGSISGKVVFDLSLEPFGRAKGFLLEVSIQESRIVRAHGHCALEFDRVLAKEERLRNIAEIGLGTNPDSILGRTVLEDEKGLGTAHVGFGNDAYFGGIVGGPHYDGVLLFPTVSVDGEEILRQGRIVRKIISTTLANRLKPSALV